MVFVSRPGHADEVEPAARVLDTAVRHTDPADVRMLQSLVDPGEDIEFDVLRQAGFEQLACLHYLQRHVPAAAAMPEVPEGLELRPHSRADHHLFLQALEASYESTRDCPSLRGVRRTEDVLTGHMATGQFDPNLWTLVLKAGRPVGSLLLNPVPEHRCVELVYLGLSPAVRGQGLGTMLLRRALAQCASRSERVITLAVDENNAPALSLYRGAGFFRVARKLALIRTLDEPAADAPR